MLTNMCSSSLARIETSMIRALERQEASKETVETAEELTPIARVQTAPTVAATAKEMPEDLEGLGLQSIRRAFTGATLVDPTALPPELTPPVSEEDASDHGSPKATSSKARSIPAGKSRKASTFSVGQETKALLPSPLASDGYSSESSKKARSDRMASSAGQTANFLGKEKACQDQGAVMEAVAEAMQELSRVRQKEQSARPLRIVREDAIHRADDALRERFQQLAEDELRIRRLNAKDWLRVATWWLLKV